MLNKNSNSSISEFHPLVRNFGTTAQRPTTDRIAGQTYFDYTLLAWIYWDGAAWQAVSGSSSPVGSSLLSGRIWVGNGSNVAAAVALSGDATLSNAGALTLATVATGATVTNPSSLTFNNKGLITAGTSGSAPVTSVGATSPVASSGGTTPTISIAITPTNPGGAVALQASSPGTTQTGSAHVSVDLRADGDVYAGDDVIAGDAVTAVSMTATGTIQGATLNATSKVQLNGVTALENGTSFPGSPSVNQRYFRTDRSIEYFYDGTRWLSLTRFTLTMGYANGITFPSSATASTVLRVSAPDDVFALYVEKGILKANTATTLDVTNNWTLTLIRQDTAGGTTSMGTASTWATGRVAGTAYLNTITVNTAFVLADIVGFSMNVTKNSAPGTLAFDPMTIVYRLIG